jgi:hypothetical protein
MAWEPDRTEEPTADTHDRPGRVPPVDLSDRLRVSDDRSLAGDDIDHDAAILADVAEVDPDDRVGQVIVAHRVVQRQLRDHGYVVSFRSGSRTTGPTWWSRARTAAKAGDVVIRFLHEADPAEWATLAPYQPASGFDTVHEWQAAIDDLHGDLASTSGALYLVVEDQP